MATSDLNTTVALALIQDLHRWAAWLETLSTERYTGAVAGPESSSLGAHVRHHLEHVLALCTGLATGLVSYDARSRRLDWAQNPQLAAAACMELAASLAEQWTAIGHNASHPLQVVLDDRLVGTVQVVSTLGRELAFLQGHGVHHLAVLALAQPQLKDSWMPSLWVAESSLRAAASGVVPSPPAALPTESLQCFDHFLPTGAQ